ncbi:DUF6251 family protein [Streptomyces sp. NPDC020875]|uniref:DUF6251 family protein n=1 Tax=Streptomyces sp. NPDC020875 TaxID=3154898 RepID=UPI0033FDF227
MTHLPEPTPGGVHPVVVRLPDGTYGYAPPGTLPTPHQPHGATPVPQVVHVHQAPPDRTLQRVALGGGVGAGAVGASVYFGPLLVAAITSMAVSLAVVALVIVCVTWGLATAIKSIGGPDGTAAAKNIARARKP